MEAPTIMLNTFDIWQFLAGLGIFLLAMVLIERALETLSGRAFKKFLRQHTNRPLKAIMSGIMATSILQSSSVVSLMVLAFVGAGIIELRNAIGIIIGSNLGTTFSGWIVAYFGFSFHIESFAFPFIAFGGLSMVFFAKKESLYQMGSLLIGFGFLFLGLEYMKSSIAEYAAHFDISPFAAYSPYLLFIVGFVLTAIIQSSSAAMVITLSALSANILSLEAAAAMVIGNDLGTTMTVLIGGMRGIPAKKQVALSHFLFNLVVDVLALIFLFPLLHLVTETLGLQNPLLTLVAFHSSFNLLGIFLFFPFLGLFARFLEKQFKKNDLIVAKYIIEVPTQVPEAAIEALKNELKHLIKRVFILNTSILGLDKFSLWKDDLPDYAVLPVIEQYQNIKELEGEITEFFINLQYQKLNREESLQINQLTKGIRQAMTAGKGCKDIAHNIKDFHKSINDDVAKLMDVLHDYQLEFYQLLLKIFEAEEHHLNLETLIDLRKMSKHNYYSLLEQSYPLIQKKRFSELEISTLMNVNREIHATNIALVLAIKEVLLGEVQAEDVEDFLKE